MPPQGIGNPSYTFLERVAISNDQTAVRRLYKDIKTFRTFERDQRELNTIFTLTGFNALRRPPGGTSDIPQPYQDEAYLQSEFYHEFIMNRLNSRHAYDLGVFEEKPDSWTFLKHNIVLEHPAIKIRKRRIFVASDLPVANDFIVKFMVAAKQLDKFYLYAHGVVERELDNQESEATSLRQI